MQNKPIFTISLDFELYWGVFDKVLLETKQTYFSNTRHIVTELLGLFEQEEVHVTWATVGMLFAQDWQEWQEYQPTQQPTYVNKQLSAYRLQELYSQDSALDNNFFAPELVKQIANTPYQELATHTFCHYYCKEQGQTLEQFREDLRAAKRIASAKGLPAPASLVFPRNQFNQEYLKVCYEEGINSVRSNPKDWFWKDTVEDKLLNKVFRTGDGYFPLGQRASFPLSSLQYEEGMPVAIPASRFLRPVNGSKPLLNKLRLKRILNEMTEAARRKECYHLWWHPHNFGDHPEQSMADLGVIINHFKQLQQKYGMVSMTMQETQEYVREGKYSASGVKQ
ncbi:polysaccharide deacetylase family protein [Pontibacter anaerobius]|uniref:Polysaccharide deacetylase family protein n=1 Tax=Pontibacter anaerobius TaxID=2993940 RepID=A0ABT3REA8_9BACT|nr:polysaccharide deacetylase family protein [Pontibacter anaerobius]MCX2739954.1 polysaccharide deacetylase family protein [Pontibacter anaerobius]